MARYRVWDIGNWMLRMGCRDEIYREGDDAVIYRRWDIGNEMPKMGYIGVRYRELSITVGVSGMRYRD